jgi:hypothetical protein
MQHKINSPAAVKLLSYAGFTLLPELAEKYKDNFFDGFFEERDRSTNETKLFHVATKEGQAAISRIKDASEEAMPDDWVPATASPISVLRKLVQQHHSRRLVQHAVGHKGNLMQTIESELEARRHARQQAGEDVSSDDAPKKKGKKKKANLTRTEPKANEVDDSDEAEAAPHSPSWAEYSAMTTSEKRESTRSRKKYHNDRGLGAYKPPVNPNRREKKKKSTKPSQSKPPKRQAKNRVDAIDPVISASSSSDSGSDGRPQKRHRPDNQDSDVDMDDEENMQDEEILTNSKDDEENMLNYSDAQLAENDAQLAENDAQLAEYEAQLQANYGDLNQNTSATPNDHESFDEEVED